MFPKLGRLVNLKIDSQKRQMDRDCFQRVRASVKHARILVDWLEHACRWRNPLGESFGRSVQAHTRTKRVRHLGQRLRDESSKVALWRLARLEAYRCLQPAFNSVDAEGPPVLTG